MTTATYTKLKTELKEELVQEFITPLLGDIKDAEGEYQPKFIDEVLKATKEIPVHKYSRKDFLKLISLHNVSKYV